ncbi:MAG: ornithine cyclodeaminase family protein [Desulfurococcales archaeon]|nr:ornithine cyclodeaminase family protein [Desulfurococcales archaeon]
MALGFRVLDEGSVEELLDWGLIDYIRDVLLGDAVAPLRASLEYGGSWFGAMPAAGLGVIATKLVGVYPGNAGRGLPLVRGVVVGFDASTGDPLVLADAGPLTGYRTAAATCLGLELLGYRGGGRAGLIGAGVQGFYHARCLLEHYGVEELVVYDVNTERAKGLVERLGGPAKLGSLEEIYESRVIVTATTSKEPVVQGSLLREGTWVASVGAPRPVWELDEVTLSRAGCVLADTREGFMEESGEALHLPENVRVADMRSVVRGEEECTPGGLRVYKGVGTALFDLAAVLQLVDKLQGND